MSVTQTDGSSVPCDAVRILYISGKSKAGTQFVINHSLFYYSSVALESVHGGFLDKRRFPYLEQFLSTPAVHQHLTGAMLDRKRANTNKNEGYMYRRLTIIAQQLEVVGGIVVFDLVKYFAVF